MEEERVAKSKVEEVETKKMESDILKKKLALSFPKENYFSVKKTVQEAMKAVKDA